MAYVSKFKRLVNLVSLYSDCFVINQKSSHASDDETYHSIEIIISEEVVIKSDEFLKKEDAYTQIFERVDKHYEKFKY